MTIGVVATADCLLLLPTDCREVSVSETGGDAAACAVDGNEKSLDTWTTLVNDVTGGVIVGAFIRTLDDIAADEADGGFCCGGGVDTATTDDVMTCCGDVTDWLGAVAVIE